MNAERHRNEGTEEEPEPQPRAEARVTPEHPSITEARIRHEALNGAAALRGEGGVLHRAFRH